MKHNHNTSLEIAMAEANQSQSMESIDLALNNKDEARQLSGTSTSQLDANLMGLHGVQPTFEPLKVCLDDDSSIEDGDEDMFDDDAFYFGDEDFQALLSRIPAKTPVSPRILTSSNMHNQNSFLPLHPSNVGSATEALVNAEHVHCIDSAASSTTGGLTSVGLSSSSGAYYLECCLLDTRFVASSWVVSSMLYDVMCLRISLLSFAICNCLMRSADSFAPSIRAVKCSLIEMSRTRYVSWLMLAAMMMRHLLPVLVCVW